MFNNEQTIESCIKSKQNSRIKLQLNKQKTRSKTLKSNSIEHRFKLGFKRLIQVQRETS